MVCELNLNKTVDNQLRYMATFGPLNTPPTPDARNLPALQTAPLALYVHPEERPLSGRDSKEQV